MSGIPASPSTGPNASTASNSVEESCPDKGILIVRIVDDTENPVANVVVNVEGLGTKKTNVEGFADFGEVEPGTYDIVAEKEKTSSSPDDFAGSATGSATVPAGGTHLAALTLTPKVLEGEVLEITWKSGIKVAKNNKAINKPHWKKGENVIDGDGSSRAAVYLFRGKSGSNDVELKINITKSENISGNGRVLGGIGNLEIEGSCPTSVGVHVVSAKIKKLPEEVSLYKGDITWGLESTSFGGMIGLKNTTRIEVFTIFDKPSNFYKKGVWVEALRFLCNKVGVTGEKVGEKAAKKITKYCHSSHGLQYDTGGGRPVYGCSGAGGTFKLASYLKASLKIVNCYDQAAAVQSFTGALGLSAKWCFQGTPPKVFGFIKETNLIGVGKCNNPFHTTNGSAKVVSSSDPLRTAFGNHAFCDLGAKILDACAGPHIGNESPTQYLNASVDYAETTKRGHTAGAASDITYPSGVTKVE